MVRALEQTAGKGRHGRSWYSPQGLGLYASVLWKPRGDAPEVLAIAAPVALAEAIAALAGALPEIRWPNDLLLDGRKVAGILLETSSGGTDLSYVVAGIGVNLSHAESDFPPGIRPGATSIRMATGRLVSADPLLHGFLARFLPAMETPRLEDWLERYRSLSPSCTGARLLLRLGEGTREGISEGLDPCGRLLVRFPEGLSTLASAEVLEVRPADGGS